MHECIDVPVCKLRTAQGIFASLPAAALLPGGPWYFTVSTVEKRATVVAVDAYGCLLIIYCSTGRSRCMGKTRMEGRRVESSRRRDRDVMSSECGDGLFQRPASSASSILRPASSVQRPDPPSSKMMQRNANSDFGVNCAQCAQPECVQRVQSGAIMNHDVHTFFASRAQARVRVRTSSAALARRVCGMRDRGIALASKSSVLCCVLPLAVFEGRTRTRTSDLESGS